MATCVAACVGAVATADARTRRVLVRVGNFLRWAAGPVPTAPLSSRMPPCLVVCCCGGERILSASRACVTLVHIHRQGLLCRAVRATSRAWARISVSPHAVAWKSNSFRDVVGALMKARARSELHHRIALRGGVVEGAGWRSAGYPPRRI